MEREQREQCDATPLTDMDSPKCMPLLDLDTLKNPTTTAEDSSDGDDEQPNSAERLIDLMRHDSDSASEGEDGEPAGAVDVLLRRASTDSARLRALRSVLQLRAVDILLYDAAPLTPYELHTRQVGGATRAKLDAQSALAAAEAKVAAALARNAGKVDLGILQVVSSTLSAWRWAATAEICEKAGLLLGWCAMMRVWLRQAAAARPGAAGTGTVREQGAESKGQEADSRERSAGSREQKAKCTRCKKKCRQV